MNIRNWTPLILQLKNICQQFAEQEFNSVLLNLYRDGSDKVGWHSDNEPELGYEPTIASLSLGAERRFKFRLREDHDVKEEIILPSGSLVVMSGPCQQLWDHEIPKELKIKTPRINLTFRRVNVKD
jgi:alkylated DNA repair dioxygenase AlkB